MIPAATPTIATFKPFQIVNRFFFRILTWDSSDAITRSLAASALRSSVFSRSLRELIFFSFAVISFSIESSSACFSICLPCFCKPTRAALSSSTASAHARIKPSSARIAEFGEFGAELLCARCVCARLNTSAIDIIESSISFRSGFFKFQFFFISSFLNFY